MFSLVNPQAAASDPRKQPVVGSSTARWENEGGATAMPARASVSVSSPVAAAGSSVTAPGTALDQRQDEIMTVTSADGRPPSRWRRLAEWRWLGIGAVLAVAAMAAWIAIRGVSAVSVAAGIGLIVLLLVGASPVLGAGLMRGAEERTARRNARLERRARSGR